MTGEAPRVLLQHTRYRVRLQGDARHIWDAHYACREVEFYIVQQLINLQELPAHGFKVAFFPLRLVGASAAPARVVAFVET